MVTMLIWSLVYRGFKLWSGQIRGVMVTMLIWSLVYRGFKLWSGQIRGVMVTMLIWSLVYRGFKLWSGQIRGVMVKSEFKFWCKGYHAHLEFSISWVQALVRSNQRCNG